MDSTSLPGLSPTEVAFLCEMEVITVVPRQRLESLDLLGGTIPSLRPPQRCDLPLWLALLLKRQKRANILTPPWLIHSSLELILQYETETSPLSFSPPPPHPYPISAQPTATDYISPPFLPSSTADAPSEYLPYHWLELGEILLETCSDDIPDSERVRSLLRDLREVRMTKMRNSIKDLETGGISSLRGIGAMEVAESRAFIVGVVDGLRKLESSREMINREREENEGSNFGEESESDTDMAI
ncbi:DNA replication complex GINS protein PSF2 [Erysiphe necator]|uniref:DNA replication complex GINS protein PSF2 n=1 Tax=Uncinula necator TaxID=52586 RepID=A0A0B1PCI7_UNCNE|nr:DNA replication complex GINS protein PSF2 [Erysiphe necator]KHJ35973.1 putative dna replication complex gins protein psf2 [Erysiphe necator]